MTAKRDSSRLSDSWRAPREPEIERERGKERALASISEREHAHSHWDAAAGRFVDALPAVWHGHGAWQCPCACAGMRACVCEYVK